MASITLLFTPRRCSRHPESLLLASHPASSKTGAEKTPPKQNGCNWLIDKRWAPNKPIVPPPPSPQGQSLIHKASAYNIMRRWSVKKKRNIRMDSSFCLVSFPFINPNRYSQVIKRSIIHNPLVVTSSHSFTSELDRVLSMNSVIP